ncbi:T9SS C-terminal target domain-containing protein [candidate division KSB1 bacterium]|nr:MAG: T9SS C-terminal target domain-containing protein [candidate division KSB1 bacterium]
MENWGQKFDRMQTPDSSVPSHREELRKRLLSHNIPVSRGRRAAVTLSLTMLVVLGGLTLGYPSWAKDLWDTVVVKTITLSTDGGMKVVIKRMGPDGQCCPMPDDTLMQMFEVGGRRAIAFKKCLSPTEMQGDSFSISTEAIIKQLHLGEEGFANVTISTPDGENTWIVNGDTIDEKSITRTVERLTEKELAEQEANPCGLKNIPPEPDKLPANSADFTLDQNYPNPFNPTTQISFDLTQSGPVTLKVFNMMGQEVTTLLNGYTDAGHHAVTFDGANLPSGTYLYTLQTAKAKLSKMMILAK